MSAPPLENGAYVIRAVQNPALVISADENGNVEVRKESEVAMDAQHWQLVSTRDSDIWYTLQNVKNQKYLNLKGPDIVQTDLPVGWQLISIDGKSYRIHKFNTQNTIHLVGDTEGSYKLELDALTLSTDETWFFSQGQQVPGQRPNSALSGFEPQNDNAKAWLGLITGLNIWMLSAWC